MPPELPIPTQGVDHIALAVPDLAPATALWVSLGFTAIGGLEELPDQGVRLQWLAPPDGGPRLELLVATGDDTPVGRFLQRRGPGMHHLAVQVACLEEALAALDRAGFQLIDTAPRIGAGGHRVAFVHPKSVGGVLFELVEAH